MRPTTQGQIELAFALVAVGIVPELAGYVVLGVSRTGRVSASAQTARHRECRNAYERRKRARQ